MLIHKTHRISLRWNQYWVMGYIGLGVALLMNFVTPLGTAPSDVDLHRAEFRDVQLDMKIVRLQRYEARLKKAVEFWTGAVFVYLYRSELIKNLWRPYYEYVGSGR